MKIAVKLFLIVFLAFWAEQVFPWWSVAVCAALVSALIPTTGKKAFWSGFAGIGLLWLFFALFYSIQTDFVLTQRVANLFGVGSSVVIILLTALIGAVVGGLGALTGNQLRQSLRTAPPRPRHYSSAQDEAGN
ncbi:hypothetical protein [Cesiribacter andamanensis]|uniref:Permease n=1 Tax=Cesiribacter andamanensis AMV16 TaxID=1279009 RepID=M7NRR0_9BACT|nr:hypothetical protein [Cesiribacter andamanensis]EMR01184.1 hypothetical protein ADICEAN_03688 [Cesiribacter andamanensis AMV16]